MISWVILFENNAEEQAKEPQCQLIRAQKAKHVGNKILELFIILRVGY